jgi:hypothetical protein
MLVADFFRDMWRSHRHRRAEEMRRRIKRTIFLEDAKEFFAGRKNGEQSIAWRLELYQRVDEMSDDEVLEWKWW